MNAIGLMLYLRQDCYEEYRRRHDELWPEMDELLRSHGIDMAIFRDEDRLYVVGVAPNAETWQRIAADPLTARWDQYMAEVLETDDQNRILRKPLEPAFLFGAFNR